MALIKKWRYTLLHAILLLHAFWVYSMRVEERIAETPIVANVLLSLLFIMPIIGIVISFIWEKRTNDRA